MGVYGEEEKFAERVELLKPYQVNMKMIKATGKKRDFLTLFTCIS